VDDNLSSARQPTGQKMGVSVTSKQYGLEEEQARCPNCGTSSKPRQDKLPNERLDLEEQEGTGKDSEREGRHEVDGMLSRRRNAHASVTSIRRNPPGARIFFPPPSTSSR
jgi:hypothetical protein